MIPGAFFYIFSKKPLMYVSSRLYMFMITVRHGDWYEQRLRRSIDYLDLDCETAVLEVGCGTGRFSKMLLSAGARLKGIDVNDKFISKLKKKHPECFELRSILDLKYPNDSFDRAIMFDVLHHIPEYKLALAEVRRVLKPGGYAIIWEGSESIGEDKYPGWAVDFLMKAFDGETNHVDIDDLKSSLGLKELEPFCYKLVK